MTQKYFFVYYPCNSQLIVPSPHHYETEKCQVCNRPFCFTNLDYHIENGCADEILRREAEKNKKLAAEKSEEEKPTATIAPPPAKRGRGRPRKEKKIEPKSESEEEK
ncbi:unnamed protein product [Caenorhabditis angaria]|uniref:Uncharacterized protein n=1 Tax=Caenorhabditis angaria TaxID=860376 RepID=A0A9P1J5A2_9PELO|nr:unnamed protein product [Caenorhabditis angaria]